MDNDVFYRRTNPMPKKFIGLEKHWDGIMSFQRQTGMFSHANRKTVSCLKLLSKYNILQTCIAKICAISQNKIIIMAFEQRYENKILVFILSRQKLNSFPAILHDAQLKSKFLVLTNKTTSIARDAQLNFDLK